MYGRASLLPHPASRGLCSPVHHHPQPHQVVASGGGMLHTQTSSCRQSGGASKAARTGATHRCGHRWWRLVPTGGHRWWRKTGCGYSPLLSSAPVASLLLICVPGRIGRRVRRWPRRSSMQARGGPAALRPVPLARPSRRPWPPPSMPSRVCVRRCFPCVCCVFASAARNESEGKEETHRSLPDVDRCVDS